MEARIAPVKDIGGTAQRIAQRGADDEIGFAVAVEILPARDGRSKRMMFDKQIFAPTARNYEPQK